MSSFFRGLVSRSKNGREIWRSAHGGSGRRLKSTGETSKSEKNVVGSGNSLSGAAGGRECGRFPSLGVSGSFCARGGSFRFLSSAGPRFYSAAAAAGAPPEAKESSASRALTFVGLLCASAAATYYFYPRPTKTSIVEPAEEVHTISNWSNTHETKTTVYIQPESLEELENVVRIADAHKQKIRPVGSGLSPNGCGLSSDGMVNLALMDKILNVDKEKMQVTVQAGARVEQVVEALKPYGLTLQNYASIKEQQIGGFIQVGAHGTGATLPPVDEQVVSLKLVTPAKGTLDLSPESDADLFYLSRCALGALGVVAEVTLQCVPRHRLLEYTFVTNMKSVQRNHKKWLSQNRHLRYMWIPDTDTVVVVQCNPLPEGKEIPKFKSLTPDEKLKHVREFYRQTAEKYRLPKVAESPSPKDAESHPVDEKAGMWSSSGAATEHSPILSEQELSELSFTELRDVLISVDPLNREHILNINKVEAQYWKLNEGYRMGYSDEILGFDCGGQQWVSEVSFPVGTSKKPNMNDIKYMEEVMKLIKTEGIPAPAPIEQRWTASSRSPMSPTSSTSPDTLYSWVGIIMYLPTAQEAQRKATTDGFFKYLKFTQRRFWDAYNAHEHWAKIEIPKDKEDLAWLQERLKKRFPVEMFNRMRKELDPNQILSNDHIDHLFPE
ncbi:hypothetical protein Mapa_011300 [Marchantia paleacea]|nr:hypothetical protein Mapa_011300 [Marchantia paleacea]